ncbi:putative 2-succinyl-6-hydroxy-2,4-cyclohexadiene-1-carboxylate synthase [Marinobacterium zhoushanense]|uniref:2-succinyl-6-hydroxy-2,4-cyclohexadiene-1-carboxylate synthase n=1 Tax=Marinobacterium zhoushanense TaxID=1679163 RepID=A0ABQ1KN74_9GAMM|nr:alpha/beta hydrolase [Marinobacterium zhoushanense]GGC03067.1 putative 2-succinyl-6-hydroxy-2,4-cyclohexadiene-1-carboxylate synthase [Marinobacterium zhoushanense]
MKALQYTVEQRTLNLPDQQVVYRLYKHAGVQSGRRLVLVHGAGVGGRDTWEMLQSFLTQWGEVLVPDMRGTGDTRYPDGREHEFTVQQLVADLTALVDHLGWWRFDLGGYSLGGMVCMLFKQQHNDRVGKQYLLESAALDRPDWQTTVALRERFSDAAVHLRTDNREAGIRQFLDTISPNRRITEQTERLTIARLGYRPEGFANALDAVTKGIRNLDREAILAAQGDVSSFIGGQSVELMHQLHMHLADGMPNWHYFHVAGTDHSLPFQKPRQIARIMNDELQRYMTQHDQSAQT